MLPTTRGGETLKTKEMKTIKQWIETLPEPYRSEAIENVREQNNENLINFTENSLALAVYGAFNIHLTKQGWSYWHRVAQGKEPLQDENS